MPRSLYKHPTFTWNTDSKESDRQEKKWNVSHLLPLFSAGRVCFMLSHLKMLLNRQRNTTDITNERTSLVTPVPINRGGGGQRSIWLNPNASTNLQFARCHFENELRHRTDGQASCGGRMDFIPDGVTVHLKHKDARHLRHSKEGKEKTTRFSSYRRIASVVVGGALVRQQLLNLGGGGI